MADHEWRLEAKCRDLLDFDLFFPPTGNTAPAKAVCNGTDGRPECPVKAACIEYALALPVAEDFGVAGGLSERDRRKLRGRRRRNAPRPLVEGDGDSRHGTTVGYYAGCRCSRCRAARSAYVRSHRYGSAS